MRSDPATVPSQMLNAARTEIYRRWRPHVGDAEARAEADRFARRFYVLPDGPLSPLPTRPDAELDAVLAAINIEMAAP